MSLILMKEWKTDKWSSQLKGLLLASQGYLQSAYDTRRHNGPVCGSVCERFYTTECGLPADLQDTSFLWSSFASPKVTMFPYLLLTRVSQFRAYSSLLPGAGREMHPLSFPRPQTNRRGETRRPTRESQKRSPELTQVPSGIKRHKCEQ